MAKEVMVAGKSARLGLSFAGRHVMFARAPKEGMNCARAAFAAIC